MAQAGLPIPAETWDAACPCCEDIFADIGDEQSIEQSLSTFSAHMTNIVRIINVGRTSARWYCWTSWAPAPTPSEGAALARSLLEEFLDLDCLLVATTHHGELKVFAHATDGIVNASAEFDTQSRCSPPTGCIMGTPGRSNALAIAQRLGHARAHSRSGPPSDATSEAATHRTPARRELQQRTRRGSQARFALSAVAREEAEGDPGQPGRASRSD